MKKLILILMGSFVVSAGSAPIAFSKNDGIELLSFRLQQLSVFQSGGNSFSGIATWNPGVWITSNCGLRLSAGGSLLKSRADSKFVAVEGALLATLAVGDGLNLEAGGGIQYWVDNGDDIKMLQANALFPMKSRFLFIFDSIAAGYAMVFVPSKLTHELRIGFGI